MPLPSQSKLSSGAVLWSVLFFIVFIWSAINPNDYYTWILEVAPTVIGFFILAATRKAFPLTSLCYVLILIHCWILMVGGHYTYAEVPLFDTIKELLGQTRNDYDKLGHFAQGFVPAIICREIIIRHKLINGRFFTHFFTVSFTLAFSAFYEMIEWWVALFSEQAAESFLGTQGYIWDTQSDMAWALTGAITALVTLSQLHDRQIKTLQEETS
ncbi:MAG: DUF2238 domain-containing protein [Proteobacteria bacterium]|nr:DUF2238 domain-containing protein [Pseudomonadota bacterium]